MGSQTASARKIMVVADPSRESTGALQYALSHVVVENDELILFHVENPNTWWSTFSFLRRSGSPAAEPEPSSSEGGGVGEVDFLESMKQLCEVVQPKIRIRLERTQMEAKDRANDILNKSKLLGIDLLIIGQRRSFSSAILGTSIYKLSGSGTRGLDTAGFLIENSACTCVAVQRKGQNAGYLLNTKTHKNFWLLA